MPTKLSRICEGIMEAAWLAAVILVPLFFNIYSSRIFEPDKITLLRTLALVTLGAWIVKLIDAGGMQLAHLTGLRSSLRALFRYPLAAPVFALALLYLISTIFSVTPRVSLLGSYQRLQGTYTTFSYLVLFLALVTHIRRRAQVDRLITAIVLTSLPISLYGVLQKYQLDPIPWGGDTSVRIAANMGNSIFVAAYLIMVFPLTMGRIVHSFHGILREERGLWDQVARATIYVFIACLQVIALYMSGSRGPALGWLTGVFFLFLLLSLYWKKRWLTYAIIGAAGLMAIFLFVFNLPGGPLQALRNSPAIGRFGLLLDAQSNSALVRKYIWQGAAKLVSPHAPLEFPDGRTDRFNSLRLFIGYGPESMYVAYNPFYVPELAQVERRNASPDRSHNETWDSMVITGVFGILVYLALFLSIFYYGLKWLRLINSLPQKILFFACSIGAGLIGAVAFVLWRGVEYFGVGLPFGILLGLLFYLTLMAVFGRFEASSGPGESWRSLTLIVLLVAIVSHFVEINFGIAIASTRTYFWAYMALMIVVGYVLPSSAEFVNVPASDLPEGEINHPGRRAESASSRKKRQTRTTPARERHPNSLWGNPVLPSALILSILLCTLGFNIFTNSGGLTSTGAIIWTSLTRLPQQDFRFSTGVLALILITWIAAAFLMTAENRMLKPDLPWGSALVATLGLSAVIALAYWLWHTGMLATIASNIAGDLEGVLRQVGRYASLLSQYYAYLALLLLALGAMLAMENTIKRSRSTILGFVGASVMGLVVLLLTVTTNLRVIQADIVFKLAEPFTRSGQWPVAITIYNRVNQLAPNEDYYYLFLGRAYLENAKTLSDADEREVLIRQAEQDLKRAQALNPLNTDHTANLARLYSLWATFSEGDIRIQKAQTSSDYFARAVKLSPNNARLWDEWALLYLNFLKQPEEAYIRLRRSLEIDRTYYWTYGLLGDYYSQLARQAVEEDQRRQAFRQAIQFYAQAMQLPAPGDPRAKFNYALATGDAYIQLSELPQAIRSYLQAIEVAPQGAELWRIEEVIAQLYLELGDRDNALIFAERAYHSAPADQAERLQQLVNQLSPTQP